MPEEGGSDGQPNHGLHAATADFVGSPTTTAAMAAAVRTTLTNADITAPLDKIKYNQLQSLHNRLYLCPVNPPTRSGIFGLWLDIFLEKLLTNLLL
jgi:hypothetical protein